MTSRESRCSRWGGGGIQACTLDNPPRHSRRRLAFQQCRDGAIHRFQSARLRFTRMMPAAIIVVTLVSLVLLRQTKLPWDHWTSLADGCIFSRLGNTLTTARGLDLRAHAKATPHHAHDTCWYVYVVYLRVQSANVLLKDFDHTLSVIASGLFQQPNVSADIQQGVM